MSDQKILVVEDDAMLADAIGRNLVQHGWRVDEARDVAEARLALVDHGYRAVLLDLGLPQGSGFDVLRAMRAAYDATPVIIVTARDRLGDRVRGLDAGADDYLVKPFQIDELLARLRAVVRRSRGQVAPVLRYGDVTVDPAQRMVLRGGELVHLSTHEYRTLLALIERPGRAIARGFIETCVYGNAEAVGSNTIAVYVHQLRRKLGEGLIATVHGYGYRLGKER
jgi:two-component system OmpR family response regulator